MTEDEAKTKWCPMVRAAVISEGQSIGGNMTGPRSERDLTGALCMGSKCMMWRWYFADTYGSKLSTTDGFCGLAGKY